MVEESQEARAGGKLWSVYMTFLPLLTTRVRLTFHRGLELGWVWRQEQTGSKGLWELTVGSWCSGLSVYGSFCGRGPVAHPQCYQNTCWPSSGPGAHWGVVRLSHHHLHAWVPPGKSECIRQVNLDSFSQALIVTVCQLSVDLKLLLFVYFPTLQASAPSQNDPHMCPEVKLNLQLYSVCHYGFYGPNIWNRQKSRCFHQIFKTVTKSLRKST